MLAGKNNGESVLITFDPHPRKVLYPDTAGKDLKLINSQEEKLDLLEKAGLDNVIIVNLQRSSPKSQANNLLGTSCMIFFMPKSWLSVLIIILDLTRKAITNNYGNGRKNIILRRRRFPNRRFITKR